jgi:hypothetical protein
MNLVVTVLSLLVLGTILVGAALDSRRPPR